MATKMNPFHHHRKMVVRVRKPVNHLSELTSGHELTQNDRIHQEQTKEKQPLENISELTGKALTHSDRIYLKDTDEIRQPVNHLSGATTGEELTQPIKNISVLTGKALTHIDRIYPKDFDEMQIAESSSGPAHSYKIYPSLFEKLCCDRVDVARNNCSKAIGEGDLPHSDRIPPTQLEKMSRLARKFSWSMDEVLMLGDRIYPMQLDHMSKPARNFSFSIKDTKMLGGRYYPLKIHMRKEFQCSAIHKSLGNPLV